MIVRPTDARGMPSIIEIRLALITLVDSVKPYHKLCLNVPLH